MKERTLYKLEQYLQEKEDFLQDLEKYPEEQMQAAPAGKWSANQVLQHLLLAEGGSFYYLQKKTVNIRRINNSRLMATVRTSLLKLLLDSPFKFKAPSIVASPGNEDSFDIIRQKWDKNDKALTKFLNELPPEAFEKEAFKHPLAGRMSIYQMIEFFESHFRRHKKQIEKLVR